MYCVKLHIKANNHSNLNSLTSIHVSYIKAYYPENMSFNVFKRKEYFTTCGAGDAH